MPGTPQHRKHVVNSFLEHQKSQQSQEMATTAFCVPWSLSLNSGDEAGFPRDINTAICKRINDFLLYWCYFLESVIIKRGKSRFYSLFELCLPSSQRHRWHCDTAYGLKGFQQRIATEHAHSCVTETGFQKLVGFVHACGLRRTWQGLLGDRQKSLSSHLLQGPQGRYQLE